MPPSVSVVMPVRNAMPYLRSAIESVLAQSFRDFELVIGDDCSADGSLDCASSLAQCDPRIRVVQSRVRLGPVGSSNFVANEARAPLVARMDADDISHPRRLERELKALAAHPRAVLVGALFDVIDGAGRVCSISPSMARRGARVRVAWRNWRLRHKVPAGHLFRWVAGRPSIDLGHLEQTRAE